jgi:hypothetical protein
MAWCILYITDHCGGVFAMESSSSRFASCAVLRHMMGSSRADLKVSAKTSRLAKRLAGCKFEGGSTIIARVLLRPVVNNCFWSNSSKWVVDTQYLACGTDAGFDLG